MNEQQIETILLKHTQAFGKPAFKKLGISRVPCWIDAQKQEGVEFVNGSIKSFWIVDNERNYEEPASALILSVLKEVNSSIIDKQELNSHDNNSIVDDGNTTLLPQFLTEPLLEKWAKMTTTQRILMFQHTPKSEIFQKPVSTNFSASYVKANFMFREANAAFLFKWSSKIEGFNITEKNVACWGYIEMDIDGTIVRRSCVGNEDINPKMNPSLSMKSAHSDMIKKGLSLLGFNNDVYSGEV
jgi:hypothetical protein